MNATFSMPARLRLKPLAEQVIVVTGATSGIGLVTARAAARRGARVVLVARNRAALDAIVAEIAAGSGTAEAAVADVGELDQLRGAAAQAIARFGRIDSWVSCAGVAIYAPLLDTPADEHERLFRTNYFGVVHGAEVAVPLLREAGGALITVGSIAGSLASPVMGAYAASKHAVKGYVESLRIELAMAGAPVSVTLIQPSGIDTPIGAHAANHMAGEAMIPPPVYDPELVATAILDAAQHARDTVTVGGAGRAQILAAAHFPQLYARLAGLFASLLTDSSRAPTRSDNLTRPARDGDERSTTTSGRRFSLYAAASRHRRLAIGAGAAAVGIALVAATAERRWPPSGLASRTRKE